MVKIFVYQIKTGKMTIDDVPERWREAVGKELSRND
ncbi:MAG: CD1375 family protein [Huintestinicola sp.]